MLNNQFLGLAEATVSNGGCVVCYRADVPWFDPHYCFFFACAKVIAVRIASELVLRYRKNSQAYKICI